MGIFASKTKKSYIGDEVGSRRRIGLSDYFILKLKGILVG
jgi:hypothetical protein